MEVAGQVRGGRGPGGAYLLLGQVFDDVGDEARAEELYELGLEMLHGHLPGLDMIAACTRLAQIRRSKGRAEEAFELLTEALEMKERLMH